MKKLMLIIALFTLGGCNVVNKLTGGGSGDDHHDPVLQDFAGQTNGPSPVSVSATTQDQPVTLEVFACTNGCVEVALAPYLIPAYKTVQPGLSTPYAVWSYAYPVLQVTFQNYGPSDTIKYTLRSHP